MTEEDWQFVEEPLKFDLGERVRAWSESAGAWKVGTVRGLVWAQYRGPDPEYREVIFDGAEERITYRASDLRCAPQAAAGSPATDDGHLFDPGDRVRVRDGQSRAWRAGTVRQVVCAPGEQVARDEYVLIISYRVDFDRGGSGRFLPADMVPLDVSDSTVPS